MVYTSAGVGSSDTWDVVQGQTPCLKADAEGTMGEERGGKEGLGGRMKVQAVAFDYYMAKPTRAMPYNRQGMDQQEELVLPVIRVFGPTPGKQKVCVHVHGVLPYMYVQYQKDWPPSPSAARKQLKQFALALETAMNLAVSATEDGSLALDAQGNKVTVDSSMQDCPGHDRKRRRRHIAKVSLVRATPFYGYHSQESLFVKIVYFNPSATSRLAAVLRGGSVLNVAYTPYEAHIPFLMQFALDFNLHGMDFIELAHPRFRPPIPLQDETICTPSTSTVEFGTQWTAANIPEVWRWHSPDTMPRQASCELEVDVLSQEIANSWDEKRMLSKDGERGESGEDDNPILPSLGLLWEDERRRCLAAGIAPPERKTKLWHDFAGRSPEPLIPHVEEAVCQAFRCALVENRPLFPSVSAFPQLAALAPPANSSDATIPIGASLCVDVLNDLEDMEGPDDLVDTNMLITQLTQERKAQTMPPCRYSTDDSELADLLEWIREDEDGLHEHSDAMERNKLNQKQPRSDSDPATRHQDDFNSEDEVEDYWQASQAEAYDIITCSTPVDESNAEVLEEEAEEDNFPAADAPPLTPELDIEDVGGMQRAHKRVRFHLESPTFSPQKNAPVMPGLFQRSQLYGSRSTAVRKNLGHSSKALFQGRSSGLSQAESQKTIPVAIRLNDRKPPRLGEELRSDFKVAPPVPPFYSNPSDAPDYPITVAGKSFSVRTSKVVELKPFVRSHVCAIEVWRMNASPHNSPVVGTSRIYPLAIVKGPPRVGEAQVWLRGEANHHKESPLAKCTDKTFLSPPARPSSPKYDESYGLVQIRSSVQSVHLEENSSSEEEPIERPCLISSLPSNLPAAGRRYSSPLHVSSVGKNRPSCASDGQKKPGRSVSQTESPYSTNDGSQQGLAHTGLAGSISLLTIASIEIFATCRVGKLPDPSRDAVHCVALCVYEPGTSCDELRTTGPGTNTRLYLLVYDDNSEYLPKIMNRKGYFSDTVTDTKAVLSEEELLWQTAETLRSVDPDVLVGFDLERDSLGYLCERAEKLQLPRSFLQAISRAPSMQAATTFSSKGNSIPCLSLGGGLGGGGGPDEAFGSVPSSSTWCPGRVVLNLWRIFRSSISTLRSFSLHACAKELLRMKVPTFASQPWPGRTEARIHLVGNALFRAKINLSMLIASGSLPRAAELARVLGLDIASVFTRGSQRRVEAVSSRLLRAAGYLPPSPSAAQVAGQPAMVQLPLVMEPEAGAYEHPVAVLDFESLYPSLMIAYNLCYSTALGQEEAWAGDKASFSSTWSIGCASIPAPTIEPKWEEDGIVVSPSRSAFVPRTVRVGVLPRMLSEILSTRRMTKAAAKRIHVPMQSDVTTPSASESTWTPARQSFADTKALAARLDGQQLALKLLANVTYGYTAAGFSGHMPMAELADAIVSFGRAAASAAKRRIESTPRWEAKVVYGDTDSLFVHFPGRTLEQAFQLAEEIADVITRSHLPPIRLKVDKVFMPCALIAKKRYVGMAATCVGEKPAFDAKGIETVRRDTCPYAAYALERCLRIFFASRDLSRVRRCAQRAFSRALSGTGRMQDYILAKEVRAGGQYRGTRPPAAVVAAKRTARDPQDRALRGERVAYVVVAGAPGSRLVDRVSPPEDLFLPSQTVGAGGPSGSHPVVLDVEEEEEEEGVVPETGRHGNSLARRHVPLQLHGMYYASKQLAPALDRVFRLVGADVQAWLREAPRRPAHHRGWGSGGALPQLFARAVREGLDPRGVAQGDIEARANQIAMMLRRREAAARRWRARRACASCIAAARCSTVDARAPTACRSFFCPVLHARYDPGH